MSYARARALQEAVFAALSGDAGVTAAVGGRVYDAPLHADGPEAGLGPYVTLGDERVEAWGARGLAGSLHDIEVGVHGSDDGFAAVKDAAGAVAAALEAPLALSAGRVVTAGFVGARARRVKDGGRRIDLRFRFRIEE